MVKRARETRVHLTKTVYFNFSSIKLFWFDVSSKNSEHYSKHHEKVGHLLLDLTNKRQYSLILIICGAFCSHNEDGQLIGHSLNRELIVVIFLKLNFYFKLLCQISQQWQRSRNLGSEAARKRALFRPILFH